MTRTPADRATATLCATQLVSWGVLFYAFPVLRVDVVAGTGWSGLGGHADAFLVLAGVACAGVLLVAWSSHVAAVPVGSTGPASLAARR